jgi:hypothetical protein
MNPQNATLPLVRKVFGCILQPIAVLALITAFGLSANAELRNAADQTRVHPLALTISPTTLPDGTTSVAYKARLRAQGGSGRYQFSQVNGDLPQGLSLTKSGAVMGTPQSAGSFSFRVLVTDLPRGDRKEATISLNVGSRGRNSGRVSVSVSPTSSTVPSGGWQQFSANVSNTSNTAVTWSASRGKVSPEGMFTAPTVTSTTNVMVMATSVADPSKSAQASVSVDPVAPASVSVSINPTSATVASAGTQQFSATVSNASNPAVTWSSSNGTISPTGLFTAPSVASTTNVNVTATSVADPSKSAQASVSVNPATAVSVSITPASANLLGGATQQFSATVNNTSNTAVTWQASNGTISTKGLFTAPNVGSIINVTITATSVADNTQSAQAMVTVAPPPPQPTAGGGDNMYCAPGDVPSFGANDGPATLPTHCFYTARAGTPSPGAVTFVPSGSNIVGVLNAANCGDTIQLQAGGTFTAVQNVPNKPCDDNHWITIETSAVAQLPPAGTRITPCAIGIASLNGRPSYNCPNPQNLLAKIQQTQGSGSGPTMDFTSGANHYRFIGIEFTRVPGIGPIFDLADLDSTVNTGSPVNKVIFDQCIFHGLDTSQVTTTSGEPDDTRTGINLEVATNVAAIDSYFYNIYCVSGIGTCSEGQAIGGGVTGPGGPYKVVNNFMEAGGEVILFGGGSPTVDIVPPNDTEIRRNHFFMPFTWYSLSPQYTGGIQGHPVQVKNLIEFKNANRVLIEGNVFQHIWGGFSQGAPIQDWNAGAHQTVTNITERYNFLSYMGQVWEMAHVSHDPFCPNGFCGFAVAQGNFSIHDNVFDHVEYSPCYGNDCSAYVAEFLLDEQQLAPHQMHDIFLNHNTIVLDNQSGINTGFTAGPVAGPNEMYNFTWKNSIIPAGQYGMNEGGASSTDCAFNVQPSTQAFSACFTGSVIFGTNLIPWGTNNGGSWASLGGQAASTLLADQNGVQFTNLAGGDYHLQASSPGHNAADDGKDVGANVDAVNTYTQGVQ